MQVLLKDAYLISSPKKNNPFSLKLSKHCRKHENSKDNEKDYLNMKKNFDASTVGIFVNAALLQKNTLEMGDRQADVRMILC